MVKAWYHDISLNWIVGNNAQNFEVPIAKRKEILGGKMLTEAQMLAQGILLVELQMEGKLNE